MKMHRNRDKPKEKSWEDTGLTFGCDRFISSPTGRWGMALAREAWPYAVNNLI